MPLVLRQFNLYFIYLPKNWLFTSVQLDFRNSGRAIRVRFYFPGIFKTVLHTTVLLDIKVMETWYILITKLKLNIMIYTHQIN